MACSRFEYVKAFEQHDRLLPGCWAVIRLDGRNFTKFATLHNFVKPNDENALNLSNVAALSVLNSFDDHIAFAFGESDEYSFILKRESTLFNRRHCKILSTIVSLYTASYVQNWSSHMNTPLLSLPTFDARIVLYPTTKYLRDYLSWRQADTHINNLYNTAFWALVMHGNQTKQQAEAVLKHTLSKDKHEILFSKFNINYNNEKPMFRKGSFIIPITSKAATTTTTTSPPPIKQPRISISNKFQIVHEDIISDSFWKQHPHLLAPDDLSPPRIRKPK